MSRNHSLLVSPIPQVTGYRWAQKPRRTREVKFMPVKHMTRTWMRELGLRSNQAAGCHGMDNKEWGDPVLGLAAPPINCMTLKT